MTTSERTTAVGVFTEHALADRAIEELHRVGFTDDQLGYVTRHQQHTALGNEYVDEPGTSGLPGAATGAVGGGIIGGVLGAAVSLLIPGFGPAIAGGILAATLGGAAIGAVAGGFAGSLVRFGVPEDEARYYQEELEAGRTIVTVNAPGRYEEAVGIMRAAGAYDASVRRDMPNTDESTPGLYNADRSAVVPPVMLPGVGAAGMGGMGGVVGGVAPGGPVMGAPMAAWPIPTAQDTLGTNETVTEDTTDVYDRKPDYTRTNEQPAESVTTQEPHAGYNVDRVNSSETDTTTPVTNEAETRTVGAVPAVETDTTTPETDQVRAVPQPVDDPTNPRGTQS